MSGLFKVLFVYVWSSFQSRERLKAGDRRASPSAEHSEPEGPEETEAATGLYSSCSVDSFHRSQMPSRSFGLTRSSAGIERVSEPGGAGNPPISAVGQR